MAEQAPAVRDVVPAHRFDEAGLEAYLAAHIDGFGHGMVVQQFQGGASNPTFLLTTQVGGEDRRFVLRKKPPGTLLASAHQVEREYRVMAALGGSGVPVPTMRCLCTDDRVIGTAFYVMDHVPGRVFADRTLPGISPIDRAAMYDDAARVMAALHGVDWRAAGLEGFGRPDGYIARQIDRWSRQYRASGMGDVPEMEWLMEWLPARLPADEIAVAHGDYRLGNLVFHPAEPRVVAVLDWELSTLGHPLADLAHACIPWRLPPELDGLAGVDVPGLPSEADFVAAYCCRADRPDVPELEFFLVFALFRWAAIAAGVYRRALDGNAADASALATGVQFRAVARVAADLASELCRPLSSTLAI